MINDDEALRNSFISDASSRLILKEVTIFCSSNYDLLIPHCLFLIGLDGNTYAIHNMSKRQSFIFLNTCIADFSVCKVFLKGINFSQSQVSNSFLLAKNLVKYSLISYRARSGSGANTGSRWPYLNLV